MAAVDELLKLLNFLAPMFNDVPEGDKKAALELAADYRPQCLVEKKQDEAQVWYALHLLYFRKMQADEAESGIPKIAGVKSLKEGDLALTFGSDGEASIDPYGFLSNFNKLNDICTKLGGSITVGRQPYGGCCQGC